MKRKVDLVPRWDQVGTKSGPSEDAPKLLKVCCEATPISELMKVLGWKNRTKFRNRFIIPLITQGLLEMTIPEQPNSRLQKYIITQAGKKLLERKNHNY